MVEEEVQPEREVQPIKAEAKAEEKAEEKVGEIPIAKGEATPKQVAEIEAGQYRSVAQIAREFHFSHSWILELVRTGRIKAIKPLGGQWRVPNSEYERIKKEGIPPLPRVEAEKPLVTEIPVDEKVVKDKLKEPEKKKEPPGLPFPFSLFTGGKE